MWRTRSGVDLVSWFPVALVLAHYINTMARSDRRNNEPVGEALAVLTPWFLWLACAAAVFALFAVRWKGRGLVLRLVAPATVAVIRYFGVVEPALLNSSDPPAIVTLVWVGALSVTFAFSLQALRRWWRHHWFDLGRDPTRSEWHRRRHVALVVGGAGAFVAGWSLRSDWQRICDQNGVKFFLDLFVQSDSCDALRVWAEFVGFGALTSGFFAAVLAAASLQDHGVSYGANADANQDSQAALACGAIKDIDRLAHAQRWWHPRPRRTREELRRVAEVMKRLVP